MNGTGLQEALITAIKNHDRDGFGAPHRPEDLEAVHEFVITALHQTVGLDRNAAIKLVHILEGGSWSKGWDAGYSSAKNHYAPKAS